MGRSAAQRLRGKHRKANVFAALAGIGGTGEGVEPANSAPRGNPRLGAVLPVAGSAERSAGNNKDRRKYR